MVKSRLGPALWLAVGISFILLGYQNCDFLGDGLEPGTIENSFKMPPEEEPGGDVDVPGTSAIYGVSEWGRITGCARSADFPDEILTVTFYVNGPAGMGERIGDTVADRTVSGAACAGHRFQFDVPFNYRDGVVHGLYAYAGSESPEGLIGGQAREFAAYDYSEAGRSFFDAGVKFMLQNSCTECHAENGRSPVLVYEYETAFQYLLVPSPFDGGTADTNNFISQINGARNHAGGNFCGEGSAVCSLIKSWWNIEFQ